MMNREGRAASERPTSAPPPLFGGISYLTVPSIPTSQRYGCTAKVHFASGGGAVCARAGEAIPEAASATIPNAASATTLDIANLVHPPARAAGAPQAAPASS